MSIQYISIFQLLILIDREIEVAEQIDPGYSSYKEAEKFREGILIKETDLREKLGRSQTTEVVRSTLTEYLQYKNYLHLVHLEAPPEDVSSRKMLCLCLCRILKTDIEFYRSNSKISEDLVFAWISDMKKISSEIKLQHPFWSLKVTPVSLADRSTLTDDMIIETDQGHILVRKKTIATNILDNTGLDVDLTDITVDAQFKVKVTDSEHL